METNKYEVKLDEIEAVRLTVKMLKEQLQFIDYEISELSNPQKTEITLPIYSSDPKEEEAELEQDRAALCRVLKFYGE